jgi:hypothetical protein
METRFPIVLLELNELTPSLMERFILEGKLPNFKFLRECSAVFLSQAEERVATLEPWIQWVTVHTGVPCCEHGILNLSEGHKLHHKCVWEVVSDSGAAVWVCGSMNVHYDQTTRGWILPDPWSTDFPPHPDALQSYFRFVQQNVLEYTKDRVRLTGADYVRFLRFMVGHGLSPWTMNFTVRELVSEKWTGNGRWRRAFILDKLQFDLFTAIYKELKPRFSTFFLNSTAHMQHMYWRDMQPQLFKVAPDRDEQSDCARAILEGYQEMDRLVGRLLKLVGNEVVIVLATALSQQPCLEYEAIGGKRGYRPRDFETLLAFAGINGRYQVAPVMAEQFWIHFESAADAIVAEARLAALRVGERRAIATQREANSVFAACGIKRAVDANAILRVTDSDSSVPFFQIFYAIEGIKSGMHHPDGMLWIRHPRLPHAVYQGKVELLSIAPTILEMLGIMKPPHMKGESLVPKLALSKAA